MNPKYPIYVISKGRWESRMTTKALTKRNIPHKVVIEPQEYDDYAAVIDPDIIAVLPFSNLGQGSIPARNWVWEDAIQQGAERHWILDDNIRDFQILWRNSYFYTDSGTSFRIIEDFADRYKNMALTGMQYFMFAPRKTKQHPYVKNTRIYSCILIQNDIPYKWRGRYNEDTDLSLRALKDGWVTALHRTFLANKTATMRMGGGNTDELYKGNGRYKMAESLVKQHPDVTRIDTRWGRYQHVVDYTPFKNNKFILRADAEPMKSLGEYGLTFIKPIPAAV